MWISMQQVLIEYHLLHQSPVQGSASYISRALLCLSVSAGCPEKACLIGCCSSRAPVLCSSSVFSLVLKQLSDCVCLGVPAWCRMSPNLTATTEQTLKELNSVFGMDCPWQKSKREPTKNWKKSPLTEWCFQCIPTPLGLLQWEFLQCWRPLVWTSVWLPSSFVISYFFLEYLIRKLQTTGEPLHNQAKHSLALCFDRELLGCFFSLASFEELSFLVSSSHLKDNLQSELLFLVLKRNILIVIW